MEGGLMETLNEAIREGLFEVIGDLLKTENFKISLEPGSKKGDNFIGIVYRVIYNKADEKKTSKLFLKIAPESEVHRRMVRARPCFLREMYVYNEVLPFFREFQESRNIVVRKEGFHEYSVCFKSIDEEPFECLFLQDLSERNFQMIDKNDLTVEHVLLVMKALGKLHAISLALKDQQPEKFTEILDGLREQHFKHGYGSGLVTLYNNAAMSVINAITDDKDIHLLNSVLKLYEKNQFETLIDCVDANDSEPYSVVIHGDMWSNNTMFKNDKQNKPRKACFIDWQMSRYASPALDLTYYIFICTTRELRGRNYNIYLKTYHESLSNHLIRLGSNPEKMFPFSALQDQLRKYGKFGLANASLILPIITAELSFSDAASPLDGGNNAPVLSEAFNKRMRDIVADMYQLGFI